MDASHLLSCGKWINFQSRSLCSISMSLRRPKHKCFQQGRFRPHDSMQRYVTVLYSFLSFFPSLIFFFLNTKIAFPSLKTRRQGRRGNVKYHYVNLQFVDLKDRPPRSMWTDTADSSDENLDALNPSRMGHHERRSPTTDRDDFSRNEESGNEAKAEENEKGKRKRKFTLENGTMKLRHQRKVRRFEEVEREEEGEDEVARGQRRNAFVEAIFDEQDEATTTFIKSERGLSSFPTPRKNLTHEVATDLQRIFENCRLPPTQEGMGDYFDHPSASTPTCSVKREEGYLGGGESFSLFDPSSSCSSTTSFLLSHLRPPGDPNPAPSYPDSVNSSSPPFSFTTLVSSSASSTIYNGHNHNSGHTDNGHNGFHNTHNPPVHYDHHSAEQMYPQQHTQQQQAQPQHSQHSQQQQYTNNHQRRVGLEDYLVSLRENRIKEGSPDDTSETTWVNFDFSTVLRMLSSEESRNQPK